jgi:hypothetical protein
MAKFIDVGDSVECNKSEVFVRKVNKPILLDIEGIGRFFKYKSKIRAIIKITEELIPKVHRICNSSNLSLHDELEGDTIEIFLEEKITFQLISNFSNVHSIQGNNVNSFTYAKILIPFRFVLERRLKCHNSHLEN